MIPHCRGPQLGSVCSSAPSSVFRPVSIGISRLPLLKPPYILASVLTPPVMLAADQLGRPQQV